MASPHLWSICIVILWMGKALSQSHTTNGDSGEPCGSDPVRRCLEGMADCNTATGKCDCRNPPYAGGNGYVSCYRNNSFNTQAFNDPNVLTYNGNSIGLPIPCRYFLTHTVTRLKDKNRNVVGSCEFQAYAFHEKDQGKFYIGGFDVAIRIKYFNGSEKLVSVRKAGKAYHGDYHYVLNASDNGYQPNGGWYDHPFYYNDPNTKLKLGCDFDETNNLAIIDAKKCGVRIQFRPYDCGLRRKQPQIPHLAYSINCAFHPEFHSPDEVVAIPPKSSDYGKTIDDILLPNLGREETLIVRALNSYAAQNAPFPNEQCTRARDELAQCTSTQMVKAFDNCLFILKSPRFIKCYDPTPSGVEIMRLWNDCVAVYCNAQDCGAVITDIIDSGCDQMDPPYPKLTVFTSGINCPPSP